MGIITAFKEIVADNRFWKDCARKAQAELLAAGKQIEKLQEDLTAARAERDAVVNGRLNAREERDAALAELGQARAELDEARKIAGNAAHKLALEDAELAAAVKRAETAEVTLQGVRNMDRSTTLLVSHIEQLHQLREENARLGKRVEVAEEKLAEVAHDRDYWQGMRYGADQVIAEQEALLGRAVAEIRRALADGDVCCTSACSEEGGHIEACAKGRMDAIIADPESAAVEECTNGFDYPCDGTNSTLTRDQWCDPCRRRDAWRAQQEEREELEAAAKDVRDVFSLGGPTWPGEGKVLRRLCVAIAKVDARSGGG